eukprot:CAMPEP_0175877034 /NCGR_PEP_ID=MMETSP0107_2-20121207/40384_1 /TAXON_ID=195067 ORGANISM="Goniomonas pacifica, Strain CCMP1869" /NCGR_SAMPLE_ID=MMETSP0107_2 /ASSEMBLY_ACC=CAM_ASM_000203 /LENGTH=74 /DNA_ID=CAMNT_0017196315 /DNA_START=240 /DNA_END=461 /DNA_ORIENTATION=-
MPPGVRASLTFPVSSTKLRHAVAQSFGHDIPEEEEEESTRWSPPQSQWPSPPQSLAPIRKHRAHQRPRVLYADD